MVNAYLMNGPVDGIVVEIDDETWGIEVPILQADTYEYAVATYDRTDMYDETGVIYEYRVGSAPSGTSSATDENTNLPPVLDSNNARDFMERERARRQVEQANRRNRGSSGAGRTSRSYTIRGEEWYLSP